jgi:hypothetical protein
VRNRRVFSRLVEHHLGTPADEVILCDGQMVEPVEQVAIRRFVFAVDHQHLGRRGVRQRAQVDRRQIGQRLGREHRAGHHDASGARRSLWIVGHRETKESQLVDVSPSSDHRVPGNDRIGTHLAPFHQAQRRAHAQADEDEPRGAPLGQRSGRMGDVAPPLIDAIGIPLVPG